MGFGILLFGYFLTYAFSVSNVYFFADIIGAVVVMYSFSKLAQYNRYFIGGMWACLAFLCVCAISAASLMFDLYDTSGRVDYAVDILKNVASGVMHFLMFLGIRGVSLGAESVKLVGKTVRNLKITIVYYVGCIVFPLIALFIESLELLQYINVVMYVYSIVCILLNLILIYSCFAVLCPAEENENEIKRSRFEFINKINDKMESFEKNRNEYSRESMKLAIEEANKLAEQKEKKEKNKRKKKK